MALLNMSFEGVEPMHTFSPIPAGRYTLGVTETELRETKAGTGQYLQVVAEVTAGEFVGRKIWLRYTLTNPNATAEQIGKRELAALCNAVGIGTLGDSDELLGKIFEADIIIEKNKNDGREGNKAVGYYAAEGAIAPLPGVAAKPVARPAAAPAAPARKPWEKKAAA